MPPPGHANYDLRTFLSLLTEACVKNKYAEKSGENSVEKLGFPAGGHGERKSCPLLLTVLLIICPCLAARRAESGPYMQPAAGGNAAGVAGSRRSRARYQPNNPA